MTPTIGLLTAIHGRYGVSAEMLRYYLELAPRIADLCRLQIYAAVSPEDESALEWVLPFLAGHVVVPNRPVSRKWQAGLDYIHQQPPGRAERFPIDGVMLMGSDDFANEAYFRAVLTDWDEDRGIGPSGIWFYDLHSRQLGVFPGPMRMPTARFAVAMPAGAGRVFGRRLLDRIDWQVWPFDADSSLDTQSSLRFDKNFRLAVLDPEAHPDAVVVDVKNGENIHPWYTIPYAQILKPVEAVEALRGAGLANVLDLDIDPRDKG